MSKSPLQMFRIFLMLLGSHGIVSASPILLIENGLLRGAQGVDVQGVMYNVQFEKIPPPVGALPFTTSDGALRASEALAEQVFLGIFDEAPLQTRGCEAQDACYVLTPYFFHDVPDPRWPAIDTVAFINQASPGDADSFWTVTAYPPPQGFSNSTFATWSVAEVEAVPEPGTLLLVVIGACVLVLQRRHSHLRKHVA
ncbi:PEP-CTERM sorting domain-containing protein [Pseudoduganella sp. SL102]|uniref:PEP-CTERM sorting domain-containing protein n=1 Tax=Pseudoduganella sp. SL102 TaxID=2995154 RepID=UPI00248B4EAA|nr:PEP-CTERM sorting domain-containing protein [Pseudoduganella sp. SL102]WBS01096.1 PEP-CTERM sorting domain-containing protein [Pseudoduganella sp. SL102]